MLLKICSRHAHERTGTNRTNTNSIITATVLRAGDMYNNTPIYTAKGVDITPFNDPCMTEGRVMLHDGCVDKPTPDNFTCAVRTLFSADVAHPLQRMAEELNCKPRTS